MIEELLYEFLLICFMLYMIIASVIYVLTDNLPFPYLLLCPAFLASMQVIVHR